VNALSTARPKGRGRHVRAVALPVVRVGGAIGVGSRGGGVVTGHPLLIVVTGCIAVRVVVDIVEIVEGTVFVVNPRVEHSNDNALTVVTAFVGAGSVHVRWHGTCSLRGHAVERHHDVLLFHNHHAFEVIDVHQCADRDFVDHHGVEGIHGLEPGAPVLTHPSVGSENVHQAGDVIGIGIPSIIDDDGNRCTAVWAGDGGGGVRFSPGQHALEPVIHAVPVQVRTVA